MSDCNKKVKHTCGAKQKAICVYYDGEVSKDSDLKDEGCLTIEETTEDLYKIIGDLKEGIDLSSLGKSCIMYDEQERGKIKIKEALLALEKELCKIKEKVDSLDSESMGGSSIDISSWNLDTSCLEDRCNTGLHYLKDIIQALIYKVCDNKVPVVGESDTTL